MFERNMPFVSLRKAMLLVLAIVLCAAFCGCSSNVVEYQGETQDWDYPEELPEELADYPEDIIPFYELDHYVAVSLGTDEENGREHIFISYQSTGDTYEAQVFFNDMYKWHDNYMFEQEEPTADSPYTWLVACQYDQYNIMVAGRDDSRGDGEGGTRIEVHVVVNNWAEDLYD